MLFDVLIVNTICTHKKLSMPFEKNNIYIQVFNKCKIVAICYFDIGVVLVGNYRVISVFYVL